MSNYDTDKGTSHSYLQEYYPVIFEPLVGKKNSDIHKKYSVGKSQTTDMSAFNYVLWKHFSDRFEHGSHINTPFKKNQYVSAKFKHK